MIIIVCAWARYTYTTLPLSLSTLPSHIHPTLPFLPSVLQYHPFSPSWTTILSLLNPTLPFLLFILHFPFFSLSYSTLTSLYPTLLPFLYPHSQAKLTFLLLSILHYPGRKDILKCRRHERRRKEGSVISTFIGSNSIYLQFEERQKNIF